MAMIKQTVVVLVALSAVWIPVSDSAKTDKPLIVARKDDIPYIKCQVCEKVASQLYRQVQKKQDQISPQKVPSLTNSANLICFDFCLWVLLDLIVK